MASFSRPVLSTSTAPPTLLVDYSCSANRRVYGYLQLQTYLVLGVDGVLSELLATNS